MAGMVLTGWLLSAVALLVGVALFFSRIGTGSTERAWQPLCAGVFFAVLAIQLTEQCVLWSDGGAPILTALFNTIQTFILNCDAPSMSEEIERLLGALSRPYVIYGVLLSLLAPLATAGSAVLVFSHLVSLPLLWLRSGRRETFVFSELNETSLVLASSIQSHFARLVPPATCTIAFARSGACADEDLLDEARSQGMLLSRMSIDRLMRWCRGRERCHMVLSERDGSANITEGLRLSEIAPQAKKRLAASVHVFSDVNETEGFADIMSLRIAQKGNCKVRRIDTTMAAMRQAMIGYPLFLTGEPAKTTTEELYAKTSRRILILGSDGLAIEFLRAALWCGRAYGVHMTVDVVDEDAAQLRERLSYLCPEIVTNMGEECHDLRLHECPPSSGTFVRLMHEIGHEVTYVLVSQADDLLTAEIARRVRGLLEACRMRASICSAPALVLAALKDPSVSAALSEAQTPEGQPYDIHALCENDILTYESLFMPHSERWATNLNRALWGCYDAAPDERRALEERADAAFESSEFNRISAMSSVIFSKHVLFSFCRKVWAGEISAGIERTQLPDASAWTKSVDDTAFDTAWNAYRQYVSLGTPTWLDRLEHERWVAYMRTLGYELANGAALATLAKQGVPQSQLARLHACLVGYDALPAVRDTAEEACGQRHSDWLTQESAIRHLPEIIHSKE